MKKKENSWNKENALLSELSFKDAAECRKKIRGTLIELL